MRIHMRVEKFLFWVLTAGIFLGLTALGYSMAPYAGEMFDENRVWFIAMGILVLLFIALNVLIAIGIYKDASRRRMNTWLWMLAVIYIPNFIGLLLYFFARRQYQPATGIANDQVTQCPHCGKFIQ